MKSFLRVLVIVAAFFSVPVSANQEVSLGSHSSTEMITARVSIATQTMHVYVGDTLAHIWSVSTARRGYKTPSGNYTPYWLNKNHRSSVYDNAPMPYAVFFVGGYAVHGTTDNKNLGRRASHGCVRLLTENARTLYSLVQQYGKQNARIIID